MLAMSPMDSMIGSHSMRSNYPRILSHTPSMDRRGPSPSVPQHRVVAERKWGLGLQVYSLPSNKIKGILYSTWSQIGFTSCKEPSHFLPYFASI